jgi:hypothetical protein
MHSGNSSTLARLRPRSKMRIFASGTPRLKRDLGYCKQNVSPAVPLSLSCCLVTLTYRLVLAVPVAAGGSPGHCVGGRNLISNQLMRCLRANLRRESIVTARECQYGISGAAEKMAALTLDFMWWLGGEVKEQRRSRWLTLDLRLIRNCGS